MIGKKHINQLLLSLPSLTGIYILKDQEEHVIYVGKAKNIQKRIKQHLNNNAYRSQIMLSKVADIETIITSNEKEALLLESNLIKQYQPKFNILLKDDKSYLFIKLDIDHQFPRFIRHRGKKDDRHKYFGPFTSADSVDQILSYIHKIFMIRSCSDIYFRNRKHPCMQYQIKRCSAPCTYKISQSQYTQDLNNAIDFLMGKHKDILQSLSDNMENASRNLEYEQAAKIRDQIRHIHKICSSQMVTVDIVDTDIILLHKQFDLLCIQIFFIRNHNNCGQKTYMYNLHDIIYEESDLSSNDQSTYILQKLLSQFYNSSNNIPDEIMIADELIELNHLKSSIFNHKIKLIHPKSKIHKQLIERLITNTKLSVLKQMNQYDNLYRNFLNIQKIFHLPHIPHRIEIYDNSHISGSDAIGFMVVVNRTCGFTKSEYRKFIHPKNINTNDDYAMMRHMIRRRFTRLCKTYPKYQEQIWPDLLIIDGGMGHLHAVYDELSQMNIIDQCNIVAMSKGKDRNSMQEYFHLLHHESFTLPKDDKTMQYLQYIRDEAHNHAIRYHRKKRGERLTSSSLDQIPKVGKTRKKILLNHFGSVDSIKEASLDEIAKVPNIGKKLAETIYQALHT